jgi:hypothetical protein
MCDVLLPPDVNPIAVKYISYRTISYHAIITLETAALDTLNKQSVLYENLTSLPFCWGTRWRSWLRHCATSRKVACSIPDGVLEIFIDNSSDRTMALGFTQPLIEMSSRNISWR